MKYIVNIGGCTCAQHVVRQPILLGTPWGSIESEHGILCPALLRFQQHTFLVFLGELEEYIWVALLLPVIAASFLTPFGAVLLAASAGARSFFAGGRIEDLLVVGVVAAVPMLMIIGCLAAALHSVYR